MRTIQAPLSIALATAALSLGSFTPLTHAQDQILSGRRAIQPEQERRSDSTLSRDILPVDTGFVVHIDVQGLLGSVWWKTVNDSLGLMDEIAGDDDFDEFREEFGIDPFKDLLSVTVIGHDQDGDDAVVILRTTAKIDKALAKVREMDQYRLVAHDGLELETWTDDDDDDAVHALVLGRPDSNQRRIVIGQSPDRVVKVARTMLGEAQSLADVDQPAVLAKPRKGSYFYLEVGLPPGELLEGTPASKIASKARRFSVDLGEKGDNVYLHAMVATETEDDAHDVADVINGARSMIALSGILEQIPGAFADVLDDARDRVEGSSVRLSLSIAMADLREGLAELQETYR